MTLVPKLLVAVMVVAPVPAEQPVSSPEGIVRANSLPAAPGSPNYFTGKATVRPIVSAEQMGQTSIGEVVFQPGARSNWHTHPGGQAITVTAGCGWTQRWIGPVVKICKGDTAYVPAGVKHWHGATATEGMTQFSVSETFGGKNVNWLEPVTDAQYAAGAKAVEK